MVLVVVLVVVFVVVSVVVFCGCLCGDGCCCCYCCGCCDGVSPSMMEMCTALRRVLGTLLSRGPWVIDGQLLLGTRPALQGQRHSLVTAGGSPLEGHHCDGRRGDGEHELHLWISGGSRLILALCSITSLATRPLWGRRGALRNRLTGGTNTGILFSNYC